MKRQPMYEVLWYFKDSDGIETFENYQTKEFYTKKSAMKFYNEHKNDPDKYGWWVTHRNSDWEVVEDLV